jgi:glycosyltransferase involved in cell wall biosynthesis
MLHDTGHHVIHYGNERSVVKCNEHVSVTTHKDLIKEYGATSGRKGDYKYEFTDSVYQKFYTHTISAVAARKQPNDFLLCFWGAGHKPIAEAHPDMITVEPGIGYTQTFARWKVFESYAMLHAWTGLEAVKIAGHVDWYNVVIPNYFDPKDFDYNEKKEDFLLLLGRPCFAKGLDIAAEIARVTNHRLIVAGAGKKEDMPDGVEFIGFADKKTRRSLLSRAKTLIAPSRYIEPFHGVLIEAAFSGTPVITVDWGAATENVIHGVTGYRCRTMDHFIWAVNNIKRIRSQDCVNWANENFTMERVSTMYQEYFQMVHDVYEGKGWYELHANRLNLDWLTR